MTVRRVKQADNIHDIISHRSFLFCFVVVVVVVCWLADWLVGWLVGWLAVAAVF